MDPARSDTPVNLDNCEAEPIHLPGAIQPHGVLLALDLPELTVAQVSANAQALLGVSPEALLGAPVERALGAQTAATLRNNAGARSWKRLNPLPVTLHGQPFDAIVHRSEALLIVELEPSASAAQGSYRDYGADIHHALQRLQSSESLPDLLSSAAEEIRRIAGYDRVMIYQFAPDDHGQIVAEDKMLSLEPFLGLHYPASDIPAQARRLYTLNWLRIIADIDYVPAPLVSARPRPPLDLSFSVLRSVSPIHVEYLQNMGVGASMSVSLVVQGKLWGLIACHHYSPRFVPFSVRMTCELLGQTLSTLVASLEVAATAETRAALTETRLRLVARLRDADYLAKALTEVPHELMSLVQSSGAAVFENGRLTCVGTCPPEEKLHAFAQWLKTTGAELFCTGSLVHLHPEAPSLGDAAAGVMAIGFPLKQDNLLLWFRPELRRTVSWAGNPEKTYRQGPNGQRLSPRGSFGLWNEEVKDRSLEWSAMHGDAAKELRASLMDAVLRRTLELERARDMLLGVVSHDLRNPLGAISLAAHALKGQKESSESVTRASARIAASSDRMRRMIEQLLDYTRAKAGKLELQLTSVDIATLCRDLAEETESAHPGTKVICDLEERCDVVCDADRVAQAISNLLSNARHHGAAARPVTMRTRCGGAEVSISVHNFGEAIPPELQASLFEPFKQGGDSTRAHSQGLGLGLYIVREVAAVHGGRVSVSSSAQAGTTFTLVLPRQGVA